MTMEPKSTSASVIRSVVIWSCWLDFYTIIHCTTKYILYNQSSLDASKRDVTMRIKSCFCRVTVTYCSSLYIMLAINHLHKTPRLCAVPAETLYYSKSCFSSVY